MKPGQWVSAAKVAFSRDGKHIAVYIAAGSRAAPAGLLIDETSAAVQVWDLDTKISMQALRGLKVAVERLAFSADGKRVATATDKTLLVWDVESGNELVTLPGPGQVGAIACSPDGKFLAASGKDGTAWIHRVSSANKTAAEKQFGKKSQWHVPISCGRLRADSPPIISTVRSEPNTMGRCFAGAPTSDRS